MPVYKDKEKTKDGRCWYFKTSIGNKPYKSKKFATKKEAIEQEEKFILENSDKDLEARKITFSQAISEYLQHERENVKPSTYKQEIKLCEHINASLGDIIIEKLTINQYKRFRADLLDKGFSVSYCNKIINHCKSIIHLMFIRYGVSTRVPEGFNAMKDNTIKKEIDFYTPSEFKRFIAAIDKSSEIKWYAFFTISYYCGTRCGENNALTWKDIDLSKRTININKTVNTKMKNSNGNYLIGSPKTKGSYRVIPMADEVYIALTKLQAYWRKFEGFNSKWFLYGGIKPLPESSIHKYNKVFADRAGLRSITIHGYRHSCCSYLLSKGCTIITVAKYLGHSDVQKALNVYGHLMPNALEEAANLFNNL